MSFHLTPASLSAGSTASMANWPRSLSWKRPKGCRPTPTTITSRPGFILFIVIGCSPGLNGTPFVDGLVRATVLGGHCSQHHVNGHSYFEVVMLAVDDLRQHLGAAGKFNLT